MVPSQDQTKLFLLLLYHMISLCDVTTQLSHHPSHDTTTGFLCVVTTQLSYSTFIQYLQKNHSTLKKSQYPQKIIIPLKNHSTLKKSQYPQKIIVPSQDLTKLFLLLLYHMISLCDVTTQLSHHPSHDRPHDLCDVTTQLSHNPSHDSTT